MTHHRRCNPSYAKEKNLIKIKPGKRLNLRERCDPLPNRGLRRHPGLLSGMLWRLQGDQVDAYSGEIMLFDVETMSDAGF